MLTNPGKKTGRPRNSLTPPWRNQAAVKVRAYRLLNRNGSKYDCAKTMRMSRTTVIKWWDAMEWTKNDSLNYVRCSIWLYLNMRADLKLCSKDLGLSFDEVMLHVRIHEYLVSNRIFISFPFVHLQREDWMGRQDS